MKLVIDGHNLIPNVPGLNLAQMDDEQFLLDRLQVYCRIRRTGMDVFFDKAPPGYSGTRKIGQISAHFIRQGQTADDAILDFVRRQGHAAQAVRVITSDRRVAVEARALGAAVQSSQEFAADLEQALRQAASTTRTDPHVDPDELEEWLRMFGEDDRP
jgi:predicted RNA-binding protein with PIN domain